MKRLEWASAIATQVPASARPEDLLSRVLGPRATTRTLTEVSRSESASQGLALALLSPEFQRR
jgi:uncharacterized protein (DUF1800 family)